MHKTIDVDTKTFIRFWLVILGFALGGLLIWRAKDGLIIILISIFFAIALRPLANRIDKIDKKHIRKDLSSILAVIIVVIAILTVFALVVPVILSGTSRFLISIPEQINKLLQNGTIDRIGESLGIIDLKAQIIDIARNSSQSFLNGLSNLTFSSITTIANAVTAIILTVVLTILFMLQGPKLMDMLWNTLSGKNKSASKTWRRIFDRMFNVIIKYVSGQFLIAILDGSVVAVSVLLLSIPFNFSANLAIPMGLIATFLYLIPMFGPIITATIVTLVILPNSLLAAVVFLIFYIIYAQIENNAISPKIQGKGMDLPPLLILIAVTIGIYSFGLIGCIVAIPIAGCIKVLIEEYPNIKELKESN